MRRSVKAPHLLLRVIPLCFYVFAIQFNPTEISICWRLHRLAIRRCSVRNFYDCRWKIEWAFTDRLLNHLYNHLLIIYRMAISMSLCFTSTGEACRVLLTTLILISYRYLYSILRIFYWLQTDKVHVYIVLCSMDMILSCNVSDKNVSKERVHTSKAACYRSITRSVCGWHQHRGTLATKAHTSLIGFAQTIRNREQTPDLKAQTNRAKI